MQLSVRHQINKFSIHSHPSHPSLALLWFTTKVSRWIDSTRVHSLTHSGLWYIGVHRSTSRCIMIIGGIIQMSYMIASSSTYIGYICICVVKNDSLHRKYRTLR